MSTGDQKPPVLAGSAVRTNHLLCQTTGPTATAIPGMSVTLNLPAAALVQMSATGDQRNNSASNATAYQVGYGFVVDGTMQGNAVWGTHIQSSLGGSTHDGFGVTSSVVLPSGTHTFALNAAPASGATNGCVVCDEVGPTVQAYDECQMNVIATPLY